MKQDMIVRARANGAMRIPILAIASAENSRATTPISPADSHRVTVSLVAIANTTITTIHTPVSPSIDQLRMSLGVMSTIKVGVYQDGQRHESQSEQY